MYLGGYEREDHAAEAYDVAALKCKGPRVKTNFPISKYAFHLCLECLSFSLPIPTYACSRRHSSKIVSV